MRSKPKEQVWHHKSDLEGQRRKLLVWIVALSIVVAVETLLLVVR